MTLDQFKVNAELANEKLALDAIQGGRLTDCHGRSGRLGKAVVDAVIRGINDWATR